MSFKTFEHVAAGRFKAIKQSNHVLQAFLGTCVGVSLYDASAKVGGLLHILLPEPPGTYQDPMPEKYAVTGLPMLIKALTDLGCTPKHLKAVIAGGALVGPVSHQDIGLDIGGRSAEIVRDILRAWDIEIINSETGGFFTCTLALDMSTGKAEIKPTWEQSQQMSNAHRPPTVKDIQNTTAALKPIPQTALKILRMFQEDRHSLEDISRELANDQVLSAQTLKVCNSALFSGNIQIDTLKDAVLLLGRDMLIKTVITAAVESYYGQTGSSGYSMCRGGLFFHAVGVAKLADALAGISGKVDGRLAYTAGLLHDIGKVVLDQFIAESAPLMFRNLANTKTDFLQSEQKLLGITHCQAGQILAKNWELPDTLSQVILHHHHPENATSAKDLVAVVYIADLLMEKFFTGIEIERMQAQSLVPTVKRLNLDSSKFTHLIDALPLHALTPSQAYERPA